MIKILHGADLHLDSPFSDLSAEAAAQCRAMQRQLPQALVELCAARHCQMLLLAGDLFDGIPYPETVQELRRALALCPVPVFIIPGNHDPLDSGLWDGEWPEQVHIFKAPGCVRLEELGCCIHHGAVGELRAPSDGDVHIGLIHGEELPSDGRIAATAMDYLAMGHIHKPSMPKKAGNTWYGWPGIPMGRGFDETGLRGVFCVELEKGSCRAELIAAAELRYETFRVPSDSPWKVPENSEKLCARVYLTGVSGKTDPAAFLRRHEASFFSLQVLDETTPERDLWEDCGDGTLRGLALETLRDGEDKELARLAAEYLLAALEGRESP